MGNSKGVSEKEEIPHSVRNDKVVYDGFITGHSLKAQGLRFASARDDRGD